MKVHLDEKKAHFYAKEVSSDKLEANAMYKTTDLYNFHHSA